MELDIRYGGADIRTEGLLVSVCNGEVAPDRALTSCTSSTRSASHAHPSSARLSYTPCAEALPERDGSARLSCLCPQVAWGVSDG